MFAERSWQEKVEHIRSLMRESPYEPTAVLLSALDETACECIFNTKLFKPTTYSADLEKWLIY